MPSHSKKQHNFMEAIAHSPSFAKKVHIPQSVGKDYAAADKGKTFKRGGDMKGYADGGMPMVNKGGKMVPSFAADGVGKMAKGGMASKMKMFEKSGKDIEKKGMKEGSKADMALDKKQMMGMKQGGKVRRMAGGGAADYLDSLENEDYAKQKEQGAKNLKSLKSFFGFGDKEEPAPIDRSRDIDRTVKPTEGATYTPRPPLGITKTSNQSPRTSSGNSAAEDEVERSDAAMMAASRDKTAKGPQYTSNVNQGETDFGYESQRGPKVTTGAAGFGQTPYEDSGFSALSKKPPVKRQKPVTVSENKETKSVTVEPSDTSYSSLEERRALNRKPAAKRSFGTANLTEEERAANREAVSGFFGKIGKGLKDMYNMETPAERRSRERKIKEEETHMAKGGKVKKMALGGNIGQLIRGSGFMDNAMQTPKASPRVPLLNPNRSGLSDLAKQKMGAYNQGMLDRIAAQKNKPMAEGGFTREADGVAKKGKTQGKVVKMASGGFVKTADGCAQRGKTKAFQVKMNRGGMC